MIVVELHCSVCGELTGIVLEMEPTRRMAEGTKPRVVGQFGRNFA
jgi:hypothetical protein